MKKTTEENRVENIRLHEDGKRVVILDQTLLPGKTEYIALTDAKEMYDAIFHLKVRGAPAIGICAAYCMYVLAEKAWEKGLSGAALLSEIEKNGAYLKSARPTAVNLAWAVERMIGCAKKAQDILQEMKEEALEIHREDMEMCRSISEHGLTLIQDGDGILTHCNAGPLATSQYGTALGPILLGTSRGMKFQVFADETRPLLQGARLTTYELQKAGVDVTLICDNMASAVMQQGWVQACFVGCDRVAANGDTANKIGTSGVAILAKHYGIPFYVLGPTSTIDLDCSTGGEIPIELRDGEEIKSKFYQQPMALPEVKCYNPSFDVTEHSLITAIVTEQGICKPPFTESLRKAKEGKLE